jgi:hypothetical protein
MTISHTPLCYLVNERIKTKKRGAGGASLITSLGVYSRLSAAFGCPVPDAVKKGKRKIAGGRNHKKFDPVINGRKYKPLFLPLSRAESNIHDHQCQDELFLA